MTIDEFYAIMAGDMNFDAPIDRVFRGLEIIRKYIPDADISSATHDIVFCCDVEEIVGNGITEDDAKALCDLNWMIDEDSLAHFV